LPDCSIGNGLHDWQVIVRLSRTGGAPIALSLDHAGDHLTLPAIPGVYEVSYGPVVIQTVEIECS
jgi:hypothetical protein